MLFAHTDTVITLDAITYFKKQKNILSVTPFHSKMNIAVWIMMIVIITPLMKVFELSKRPVTHPIQYP